MTDSTSGLRISVSNTDGSSRCLFMPFIRAFTYSHSNLTTIECSEHLKFYEYFCSLKPRFNRIENDEFTILCGCIQPPRTGDIGNDFAVCFEFGQQFFTEHLI